MGNTNPLAYHLPPVVVATVVVDTVANVVVATVVVATVAIVVVATVVVATVAIVVVATVADGAVVVLSTLRAKLIPNGMQKAAAARTPMTIPTIIQNSLCLVLLFSIGSSSHTDARIVLVSFQFGFFNH